MVVPITGYLDRLSVEPGGQLAVKVSSTLKEPYEASLLRIEHGDPNPAGPGIKLVDLSAAFSERYPSRFQPTYLGSYGRVDHRADLTFDRPFTLVALIHPTLLRETPQAILSKRDTQGRGFALMASKNGLAFEATARDGQTVQGRTGRPLLERKWYRVFAACDPVASRIAVGQQPLRATYGVDDDGIETSAAAVPLALTTEAPFLIGALGDFPPTAHFNGKIEDPAILADWFGGDDRDALDPATGRARLLAWWDLSVGIETQTITDVAPRGLNGRLVNLPTRGVTGARWSGREMCWRHAPRDYAAIHFHEDDLYDCGWETDFTLRIPDTCKSGVYGIRLRCGDHEDTIPFYIRPKRDKPGAPILFLASTFTYQAYANHARGNRDDAYRRRVRDWNAYPWNPDDHPEYGRSTYNRHSDGSGICFSSRLRPILTMRSGFLTFMDSRGSGLRHFPADTHLLDWLGAKEFDFDVVTDEDLDADGTDLLRPYRVVLTGSHPEYHTKGTLDALQEYVDDGGGRLVYLGGNGFYWRIARSSQLPGVIEVRRAEGGIRAWAAEPGESYHSLDGGYGGLWRRNGRPPQRLAGVGFSAQGLFEGSYYGRLPASSDERAAWIFEGIEDEVLGDFGLSGGGAAGFEIDRADVRLGTPPHTLILARSEAHSGSFIVVPEELLSHIATWNGEKPADLVRSEIVYFEAPDGGAVFSVGSITFCGSLSHNGYDNNVSRMLENVVRRFSR